MIHSLSGDILNSKADALVNPVNCVGVMGKGLALQFRSAFRENYAAYRNACERGEVRVGRMFVFELQAGSRWIINFPTKQHWREKGQLRYVRVGLCDLVRVIHEKHIRSIAIPRLGCGLGGLLWEDVRPMIVTAFKGTSTEVYLYELGNI